MFYLLLILHNFCIFRFISIIAQFFFVNCNFILSVNIIKVLEHNSFFKRIKSFSLNAETLRSFYCKVTRLIKCDFFFTIIIIFILVNFYCLVEFWFKILWNLFHSFLKLHFLAKHLLVTIKLWEKTMVILNLRLSCLNLVFCSYLSNILFHLWFYLLLHNGNRNRYWNLLSSLSPIIVLVLSQDVFILVSFWIEWLGIDIVVEITLRLSNWVLLKI